MIVKMTGKQPTHSSIGIFSKFYSILYFNLYQLEINGFLISSHKTLDGPIFEHSIQSERNTKQSVLHVASTMEDLDWRFSLISKIILNNVDDISLANFKKASRENSNFLENERFYWIRIIKKYSANFEEFKESWKKVISKTQVDFLKNLAIDVQTFFNSFSKRYNQQWHPLFIGAERGSLPLCEHVVKELET